MKQNYKGLIFTNHALQRMKERGLRQKDIWATWFNPDTKLFAKNQKSWVYFKNLRTRKIKVVAKQNERKQWIVLSVWSTFKVLNKQSFIQRILKLIFKK